MAFTGSPTSSTQYDQQTDPSVGGVTLAHGPLQVRRFSYTHAAGAGVGEINLIRLPPGKVVIFPELSYLRSDDMAANADLHLGHRAYVQADGTEVAEDDNEWVDNADSGGGALQGYWGGDSDVVYAGSVSGIAAAEYDAADGLIIYVMIDTGNIEDTDVISGFVTFAMAP